MVIFVNTVPFLCFIEAHGTDRAENAVIIVLFALDEVHKVLTLTAKKRDQRRLQNSDKNKLVEIKVTLEAN